MPLMALYFIEIQGNFNVDVNKNDCMKILETPMGQMVGLTAR